MGIIVFLPDYTVVDRIIDHLKLRFVAAKPPPSHVFAEVALPAAEESGAYSWLFVITRSGSLSSFSRCGGISYPDMICGRGFCGYWHRRPAGHIVPLWIGGWIQRQGRGFSSLGKSKFLYMFSRLIALERLDLFRHWDMIEFSIGGESLHIETPSVALPVYV